MNGCILQGLTLGTLPLADYQTASTLFEVDIYQALRLEACAAGRNFPAAPPRNRCKTRSPTSKRL